VQQDQAHSADDGVRRRTLVAKLKAQGAQSASSMPSPLTFLRERYKSAHCCAALWRVLWCNSAFA
jgi:hypothetical protein